MEYLGQIGIVFVLLAINGWFAMSELAMVSSRRARLEAMASSGDRGAARALRLIEDPGRFLSSVQIGITLVGILAGAYSGATLAEPLADWLVSRGVGAGSADLLSIAIVVGSITYASLVVGELVPKQIALSNPEKIAAMVARPMSILAKVASPVVWLLDGSSRVLMKILRINRSPESAVTEEEIRAVIAEGTKTGILEPQERELMAGVMRFSDRSTRGVMTPRRDIVGIDLAWDQERIIQVLRGATHSRYPVFEGSTDEIVGVVQTKDILDDMLEGRPIDIRAAMRPVQAVPDSAPALSVLDMLRQGPNHMLVVMDEYGSVEGIVTAADILDAIAGSLPGEYEHDDPSIVQREDGTWLLDGDLPVDIVADRLACRALDDPDRDYETLAGFFLSVSKAIPSTGDTIDWSGWRFEIVDMDGRRIDKLLATAPQKREAA
jgi:putative hemolysin